MKFIFTIDVEADNQWLAPSPKTVENIEHLPRMLELCDEFGFKADCLISYEIAVSKRFRDLVEPYIDKRGTEIGAHLHPWSCPPFKPLAYNASIHHMYPHELTVETFSEKMQALTGAITDSFGARPISYRAGRWGFCADHIPVLLDLGYKVDCSVTPCMSWSVYLGDPSGSGGPDYRRAPNVPYYLSSKDITKAGRSGLLEIPSTVVCKNRLAAGIFNSTGSRIIRSALARLQLAPLWFNPMTVASGNIDIGDYLTKVYEIARRQKLDYVQLTTHSSELMPGGSPFWPSVDSIERLYDGLRRLFVHMSQDGCEGVTLSEFSGRYKAV